MRTIGLVSLTVLASWLFAGEAEPWLTLSVSDGVRSSEHFNASVYGKVVNAPEFAPLKAKWLATIAAETAKRQNDQGDNGEPFLTRLREAGINPFDLLSRLRFFEAVIQGEVKGKTASQLQPGFRVGFDLGNPFAQLAAQDMAQDAEKGKAKKITVTGADDAYIDIRNKSDLALRTLRFADQFVLTNTDRADWQKPVKPASSTHDLTLHLMPALCAAFIDKAIPAADRAQTESLLARMRSMMGAVDLTMDLVPAGLATRLVIPEASVFTVPVDKKIMEKLPTNTLSAIALGIDGAAWWTKERAIFLQQLGATQTPPVNAEQMEKNLDAMLKSQGLTCSTAQLAAGIKGTGMIALMQAVPFPTVALAIPRSQAFDAVVALALKKAQQEMPAEGAMAMIPLGMIPISLTLVRAPSHWLLTTDSLLASTWTDAAPGGWLNTPVGKLALDKAGTDAWMIGGADNAAEIRMYTGFLALGIQQVPNLSPEERQAVLKSMQILTKNAQPGWCTGRNKGRTSEIEITGLTGGIFPLAIVSAIAIPNLLESRSVAHEAAAAATLKSGIFPAQIQFQAGGYLDQDQDGIGEFGFFQELSGGPIAGQKADLKLQLLPPAFNVPEPENAGFGFAIFLPDGQGGAVTEQLGMRATNAKSASAQKKHFVAYAWPVAAGNGRKAYAITEAGVVYVSPAPMTENPPAWNDLFGGKGWDAQPAWPPYKR